MIRRASLIWMALAARAWADGPSVAIERVAPSVCFSGPRLLSRVRSLHDGPVRLGGHAPTEVTIARKRTTLLVTIHRRTDGKLRAEQRTVPIARDCQLLLDTVAVIIARAAAPLTPLPLPPISSTATTPPTSPTTPTSTATTSGTGTTTGSGTGTTTGTGSGSASGAGAGAGNGTKSSTVKVVPRRRSPERKLADASASPSSPSEPQAGMQSASPAPAPPPAPETISTPAPFPSPPSRPRIQFSAAFRYAVALDTGPSQPGLLAALDARLYRRLYLTVGGGVEGESVAPAGGGSVTLRRVPLRLGLAYEQPIPSGALRFTLGAFVALWTAFTDGIARPDSAIAIDPGAFASIAYHLRLGRAVDLFAGVDVEYAAVSESFTVDGIGPVASTPSWWVCPFAGASLNFF